MNSIGAGSLSRRALLLLLPSLGAAATMEAGAGALPSRAYSFESIPARHNGENTFRPVFQGTTHSGFAVELHESDLAPGGAPHPAHHHEHEEVFMVREGVLEITVSGETTRLGPGSVAYVASNQEHGIRNPGPGHAQYFVFALGQQ